MKTSRDGLDGGHILVDFDGTLATHPGSGHTKAGVLGEPIPAMLETVRKWLDEGREVRIFTARVAFAIKSDGDQREVNEAIANGIAIRAWCEQHLGRQLQITTSKNRHTDRIYDDRAIYVERDAGWTMPSANITGTGLQFD